MASIRRHFTHLLVGVGLSFAAMAPALAAPPTDADVNRLLSASRAQTIIDSMLPQIEKLQRQQFEHYASQRQLTADERAKMERIQQRTSQVFREELSWQKMRPMYLELYKQSFSKEDVLAMAEFYESSAGQSLLDKTPALMQNAVVTMQARLQPMLERLDRELSAIVNEPPASMQAPVVDVPEPRPVDLVTPPKAGGKTKP